MDLNPDQLGALSEQEYSSVEDTPEPIETFRSVDLPIVYPPLLYGASRHPHAILVYLSIDKIYIRNR